MRIPLLTNMDKTELIVWGCYGAFVIIGLLIFVGISCYVRTKMHICEEEHAMIRKYNKQLAKAQGNSHKDKKNKKDKQQSGKETFSLFNLLN